MLKEEEKDGLLLNPSCLQDKAKDKGEKNSDSDCTRFSIQIITFATDIQI